MGATGTPDIVARGRLDAEAVAVDVRTLQMTSDMDGPLVRFLYFAYYVIRPRSSASSWCRW